MTQKDKKKEAMAGLLGGLTKPSQQPEQLRQSAGVPPEVPSTTPIPLLETLTSSPR